MIALLAQDLCPNTLARHAPGQVVVVWAESLCRSVMVRLPMPARRFWCCWLPGLNSGPICSPELGVMGIDGMTCLDRCDRVFAPAEGRLHSPNWCPGAVFARIFLCIRHQHGCHVVGFGWGIRGCCGCAQRLSRRSGSGRRVRAFASATGLAAFSISTFCSRNAAAGTRNSVWSEIAKDWNVLRERPAWQAPCSAWCSLQHSCGALRSGDQPGLAIQGLGPVRNCWR